MSIPSTLPLDNMSFHGLPSTNHVLEQPRKNVVNPRSTVRGGRPLEEGERV